ncbi:unnamed protein product [Mesocestoides corti]|uniref:receptor protein-tyrosine kinase n=1 Tax=Mesocestoides corti TaxID=53468 RepID=A0A0R3UPK2_MESCO|nr:unnamed protein product [Mesocestoides corti]
MAYFWQICVFCLAIVGVLAKEHQHLLTASSNADSDVFVDLDVTTLDFVCPSRYTVWFLPQSATGVSLHPNNHLRIALTDKERPFQRGFYACCPRERAISPNVAVQRVQTPACCPCCSWPEEEYCSNTQWNESSQLDAPPCIRVFLFTGMVPRRAVTIPLPWRSKVLIPCPAPSPTMDLRVYRQLPKIRQSRQLWFNTSMTDVGQYDPRFGLCTQQIRVPGGHMQLSCEYPTSRRIIKPQPPSAPPTLLPNVTCVLQPIEQEFDMRGGATPEFRVFGPRNLTVSCTAVYTNMFIAKRHPTLCFRWRHTVNVSDHQLTWPWSRYACLRSELFGDTITVAATHAYNFTADGHSTTVEVEVAERYRATPAQNFFMRLHVSPPSTGDNRMHISVAEPTNSSAYSLFSDNLSDNRTLVVLDTAVKRLTLAFYALDEITQHTACFSSTLPNESFSLGRTADRWLCEVALPEAKFNVSLKQGDLEVTVTVYPSPDALLPRSTISGLRGSVDVYINVTCPVSQNDASLQLPDLFNTTPSQVRWLVFRGESLVNETYTKAAWLEIAPLINSTSVSVEPVLELESSSTPPAFEALLSNLSTLVLPPVVNFSRRLCVSCETFFAFGSSKSARECVTLEAKDESEQESLSVSEAALRRFSSYFLPLQVSNVSNPSFRITRAFPAGQLNVNQGVAQVDVYAGSVLELRCSLSRTNSSSTSTWPLIALSDADGDRSLPHGHLQFYALPFALETRLQVNSTAVTAVGSVYSCGDTVENLVYLVVDVVPTLPPKIVEPNQSIRYFTANEIVRLTCRAVGGPMPIIVWRLVSGLNKTQENSTVLKWCNASLQREENSCSLMYIPTPSAENTTIECKAVNYLGSAVSTLHVIRVSTNTELAGSIIFNKIWKSYIFWITVPSVILVAFVVCLWTVLWRKNRQMVKADKLIKMDNLIYGRTDKLPGNGHDFNPFYHELLYSLMPTDELRERWCLDRRDLRPFPQSLGTGHYGTVQKGIYYGPRVRQKKHPDAFFVALKSPSAELASLTCFRNEIAHLMRLSDGPNIVKMIGCAIGDKSDLRDSLLVLEFCPNTSLSDFIRRMLYPRGWFDNRPMFVCNAVGEISTGSSQISTTPFPSSDSSVSQFALDAYNAPLSSITGTPVRILRNEYEDADATPKSQRRRRRGGRRNTALVYQRLTLNSSTIFLQIATGIARGLEYLALNNVIHRDLATRNILMDAKYEPKICDFGLAVTVDSPQDSSDGAAPDSGCYHIITFTKQLPFRILPPEALSKQLFYLSSDVWEFGLLLWQMFFFETRKPFEDVQSSDALLRLLSGSRCIPNGSVNYVIPEPCSNNASWQQAPPTIDRPPAVPDAVWEVICDCLRIQAAERPAASEVLRRLVECSSAYEDVGDVYSANTLGSSRCNDCQGLCQRPPGNDNAYTVSPTRNSCFPTYENLEQTNRSAAYLESCPSSSL